MTPLPIKIKTPKYKSDKNRNKGVKKALQSA